MTYGRLAGALDHATARTSRDTPKKNLAIKALKKLINGEVHSQAKM